MEYKIYNEIHDVLSDMLTATTNPAFTSNQKVIVLFKRMALTSIANDIRAALVSSAEDAWNKRGYEFDDEFELPAVILNDGNYYSVLDEELTRHVDPTFLAMDSVINNLTNIQKSNSSYSVKLASMKNMPMPSVVTPSENTQLYVNGLNAALKCLNKDTESVFTQMLASPKDIAVLVNQLQEL